jgi:hypothetical protein
MRRLRRLHAEPLAGEHEDRRIRLGHAHLARGHDQRKALCQADRLELRALRLVALVAERGDDYDLWACRWLARWLSETPETTISLAAEVAATLADLPAEPAGVEAIHPLVR